MKTLRIGCISTVIFALLFVCACGESGDSQDNQTDENQHQDSLLPAEDLSFAVEPDGDVTAGDEFDVAVQLLDGDGEPTAVDGSEVTVELNQAEFADGSATATATTDSEGRAGFALSIETIHRGLVLTATADGDELSGVSVTTSPFDIVAAAAAAGESTIEGEDGVDADGEEVAGVTIELFDEYGNPVDGVTPGFVASGEGNDYHDCSPTGDEGRSSCGMTSTEPGEKTLEITDPVEVVGETIEFVVPCDPTSSPFGGGAGTDDDPYRLCAPAHLDQLGGSPDYLGEAFIVVDGIDMEGFENFNIIGFSDAPGSEAEHPFSGTFDGRGHQIRNLSIDATGEEGTFGLFGEVDESASIKNLVVDDIQIEVSEVATTVGGLVANNYGEVDNVETSVDLTGVRRVGGLIGANAGEISNSQTDGAITIADDAFRFFGGVVGQNVAGGSIDNASADVAIDGKGFGSYVGGLVGSQSEGEIQNSHATGNIDVELDFVGGLAGQNADLIVESYATGNVVGHYNVGGFVGRNYGEVIACNAEGEVEGGRYSGGLAGRHTDGTIEQSDASGSINGGDYTGGLVGFAREGAEIIESHATGDVEGDGHVGGLVGENDDEAVIEQSYATGFVTGESRVGGLVGRTSNEAEIIESYVTGDVDGEGNVGGFVGMVYSSSITDSYATGEVTGQTSVGGFVGFINQSTPISYSYSAGAVDGDEDVGGFAGRSTLLSYDTYFDSDTSGIDEPYGGAEPLTTDEFGDEDNFPDWEFDEIWVVDEAPDDHERPVLQWQEE